MNRPTQGMQISCPQCGQRFSAIIESIIDAARDPAAKARFLSRRTNMVQCPKCGAVSQLSVPLAYHDPTKDLLLVYFPMELNVPHAERERVVGEITRVVMESLPKEQRKGYLFNPIQPLSLEGMLETVLEKEGITREMMATQREKMKLVEKIMSADLDDLPALVEAHDTELDADFFQLVTVAAESALAAGRQNTAEAILSRRDELLEMSSYGQEVIERAEMQEAAVQDVANWIRQNGNRLDLNTFFDYLVEIGDSDDHLQALVGLARGAFDYNFFTHMSEQIEKAPDDENADFLKAVRDRLLELTQMIDQQQMMIVQQAQAVLRDILNAPDMDRAIEDRLPMIDDVFLSVLSASIQAAEQRNDLLQASRLKSAYEGVMQHLRATAPPEVQFINELLTQEDPLEAKLMLSERAGQYGQPLVDYMEALIQNMQQRGAEDMVEHLTELRDAAERIITGSAN
ncbi:MAG TPA: CpXC domain-containing protein [Aggregatilineales bacterium]|nr:CpXC domain-containing protein [Aggregatilineales bacterium]